MRTKPSDKQISDLGFKVGVEEKLNPSGLTDLPGDCHSNELDKICGDVDEGYYAFGDEEGDRMYDLFKQAFLKGMSSLKEFDNAP